MISDFRLEIRSSVLIQFGQLGNETMEFLRVRNSAERKAGRSTNRGGVSLA